MFSKKNVLELPQRVTAYYLFFGLMAILWLGIGVVFVAISVLGSRAENAHVHQMGRAAPLISVDYLRNGEQNLQSLIDRIHHENSCLFCAVVSNDGRYVAHTSPEKIGRPAIEPAGPRDQWGDVQRVRYQDEQTRTLLEYCTPLRAGDRQLGSFRMTIAERGTAGTWMTAARHAPLAIVFPLTLILAGGITLRRIVGPIGDIEGQLRQAATVASVEELTLSSVPIRGPASVGWNRLIQQRGQGAGDQTLEQRITDAGSEYRHRKMDNLLNNLTDGIAVTDGEGATTFANRPLLALLDLPTAESLTGRSLATHLKGAWDLPPGQVLLDPQLHARSVVAEVKLEDSATPRTFRVARNPVHASADELSGGHVWSFRDITQQKNAECMRDQFVTTATHELRTPLANIKTYAETLTLTEVLNPEQQKKFLNTIHTEASRLARFVDDLLSVNSMEVGSLTVDRRETDVLRLLGEVTTKVQPQMDEKQIRLDTTLPPKLAKLHVDKDKLAATLVNLLSNATKYTPQGGEVALRTKVTEQALVIEVIDSGYGISADELPKVFDKFFRSADPRVQQEAGSGLGLSLAREVARLHGGNLRVNSELEKGTTFTLTLPL